MEFGDQERKGRKKRTPYSYSLTQTTNFVGRKKIIDSFHLSYLNLNVSLYPIPSRRQEAFDMGNIDIVEEGSC